jgi:hypothetical protein
VRIIMESFTASDIVDKLAEATNLPTDKIKKKLREMAINNTMRKLESKGKTPFDVGKEGFEILVAEEEKTITVAAATRTGLAALITALMSLMIG